MSEYDYNPGDQYERLVIAIERIAGALVSIAKTTEMDYERRNPPKREPREVEVHYLKTEEETLRESQGDTGEASLRDWTSLGPRERAFMEKEEKRAKSSGNEGSNGSSRKA